MNIKYFFSITIFFNFFYIIAELPEKFLAPLLSAKRNYFCKEKSDFFAPSQCEYDTQIALEYYFATRTNSPIPFISFKNNQEFEIWKKQQTINTYLIISEKECTSCASLLAAIESRIQTLKSASFKIYIVDINKNPNLFMQLKGTPTVFKINSNTIEEISLKSCFNLFIKNQ